MANVLELKTVQNDKAVCDFVVISIPTIAKYNELSDNIVFNNYIKDNLKKYYEKVYDSYGIIYTGNLLKFHGYNTLVDKLPKRGYRDYTQTLEKQLASKSSIIIAEDTATSWNTVRSALGARNPRVDCFGIILEVIKNK